MRAAFFDLDKTVIARPSMVAFSPLLRREGYLSRWLLARAVWAQVVFLWLGADESRLARMRDAALRATTGWPQDRIRALVTEAIEEVIDPIVFAEALDLIEDHRAAGDKVFLVSASPVEIVEPLARHLGVHEAIGTRARVDGDGCYTGDVEFYCYGPSKVTAIERVAERDGIDLGASFAYSDSATDLPMLRAVGHPVVVNPDRELARVAGEEGWEVRHFIHPVRLRDRVRMPSPRATVAVGGGMSAVAAAAGAAWWWLSRQEAPPDERPAESPVGAAWLWVRRSWPSWPPGRRATPGSRAG